MPFNPRSKEQILQSLTGRFVARSALSDLAESASSLAFLETASEEFGGLEYQLMKLRDSFDFLNPNISLADFDARIEELPGDQTRKKAVTAAGGVAVFSRATGDAAGALTLPAGTVVRREDDPSMLYQTVVDVVLAIGVVSVSGVYLECLTPGVLGNCAAGTIKVLVSYPERIIAVSNTAPLTTGTDEENLKQAQARMSGYFASLSRTLKASQQFWALSYQGSGGQSMRFARIFQDYSRPGYAELIVDDGTGLQGLTRVGQTVSGVVPASGQIYLWHEMPATFPIEEVKVTLFGGGTKTLYLSNGDFVSVQEKGLIIVSETALAAGDTWEVSNYSVYSGIIGELQLDAEGDPSDPANQPGWIADGDRLVIRPPDVQPIYLDMHVVPVSGIDLDVVKAQAVTDALSYIASLAPGEPLYIAKLTSALLDNADLDNVHVYLPNSSTVASDIYVKPYQAARSDSNKINAIASLPGS